MLSGSPRGEAQFVAEQDEPQCLTQMKFLLSQVPTETPPFLSYGTMNPGQTHSKWTPWLGTQPVLELLGNKNACIY